MNDYYSRYALTLAPEGVRPKRPVNTMFELSEGCIWAQSCELSLRYGMK
ncbi:hypothetical protein HMPREF1556_01271 [Porphyromonas sp. oral taxon 278 str. W7784]|nr:hypothetical protein HMPREF1556_01271 [Porphyromonas sp. oral taxon 278 str. W7784]